MNMSRPSYKKLLSEMEWTINKINVAENDRNPHRAAHLRALIEYGIAVCQSARECPVPKRPVLSECV